MKCPLCEKIEVEFDDNDKFLLNCPIHGNSPITKEAIYHFTNFNKQKQEKITEFLSKNPIKVITTRTLDKILREP